MRLCTYLGPNELKTTGSDPARELHAARLGVVHPRDPERILDVAILVRQYMETSASSDARALDPLHMGSSSLLALLQAGPAAFSLLRRLLDRLDEHPGALPSLSLREIRLLSPLPRPASLRDCMAFEQHLVQSTRGGLKLLAPKLGAMEQFLRKRLGISVVRVPALFHSLPVFYKGNPASVVGPDAIVRWPRYTRLLDYELELALILFETPPNTSEDSAAACIAGVTLFNDFSARDTQLTEMKLRLGPARGKDFDTGNALGPFLVTLDELGGLPAFKAIRALKAKAWIGERLVTDSGLASLQFSPEQIVSFVAEETRLEAGAVIGLGTVPGGCGLEHGIWLKPGDTITLEVEGVGRLSNRIQGPEN